MQSITYVLIGDPVPLARPRMSGPSRNVYDSQKLIKYQLVHQLIEQHGDKPLYSGPLSLDVIFYMPMPKGMIKQIERHEGKYHIYKPDIDNLFKMVGDLCSMENDEGMKGILMQDDCIISSISAKKIYSKNPRTEFTIRELK